MNSEDYSGYQAPQTRKTQVVTLYMRQLQMMNFYNSVIVNPAWEESTIVGGVFIGLAKTTPWSDPDDPDISDTFPPIPTEDMTELQELVGMQRITWKKYAKPYVAPTTAQKDDANTVYYKGLYYETTNDLQYALDNGFTAVMCLMTADRDEYFPVDISVRQVGLFVGVNSTNRYYIDNEEYQQLSEADKGHLVAVENFMPLTRQRDQLEKYFFLMQF